MSAPEKLRTHLKDLVVRSCGLTHVSAAEITDDEILFGPDTRVQLNSLDAVEIAMNIEMDYGVKMENSSSAREFFKCIQTLSDHIATQMKPERLKAFE